MNEIIKEILKSLPEGRISDASFEGANIVLYTKDREYFLDNKGTIKNAVDSVKKRIELRADPAILLDEDRAKELIKKIFDPEAGIEDMFFEKARGVVTIETEKPGAAIGKQGQVLREIKEKTMWTPSIRRASAIKSNIIDDIKALLYANSEERRKFLDRVGHRIYDGWTRARSNEWVRISYLGAAREVGRSALLLQTPESRILLDCGINVAGQGADAYPILEAPEFDIEELDAVILSHAHIDHMGLIPFLFKMGYKGPIYCTPPTRDVSALSQIDTVKIAKGEGKEPPYDMDDIKSAVKNTIVIDYEEVTDITPDVRLTLYNAGHILGSAMVHLHIGNGLHNLLYTGDINFAQTMLLDPSSTQFPRLETMIIESTYGSKLAIQEPEKEADEKLAELVQQTVERGGKVLMPVLGVGRAQNVMVLVDQLMKSGKMKDIPVFIDGMVWEITAIHTAYPEYMNSAMRKKLMTRETNPFLNPNFKRVGSGKERKQIIDDEGPCIIIATSGMLTGGSSVEYFKGLAENPKNLLVFSSYQGEGTLGKRIQRGDKEIAFAAGQRQEMMKVNMEVAKISISGHADRNGLMNFVSRVEPRPRKIIVNHGEAGSCLDFATSIHKQFHIETS
ncbi:MAG TPA: beta-CASP ribonuclease aCPSF1, partial [Candidatus Nanoarchaeia archaeon]|nr:beta-CASP ribonuclease aCPSF1 [Candidatus Nanoarchaeia archaeon]